MCITTAPIWSHLLAFAGSQGPSRLFPLPFSPFVLSDIFFFLSPFLTFCCREVGATLKLFFFRSCWMSNGERERAKGGGGGGELFPFHPPCFTLFLKGRSRRAKTPSAEGGEEKRGNVMSLLQLLPSLLRGGEEEGLGSKGQKIWGKNRRITFVFSFLSSYLSRGEAIEMEQEEEHLSFPSSPFFHTRVEQRCSKLTLSRPQCKYILAPWPLLTIRGTGHSKSAFLGLPSKGRIKAVETLPSFAPG